jgi:hypothetical protein
VVPPDRGVWTGGKLPKRNARGADHEPTGEGGLWVSWAGRGSPARRVETGGGANKKKEKKLHRSFVI